MYEVQKYRRRSKRGVMVNTGVGIATGIQVDRSESGLGEAWDFHMYSTESQVECGCSHRPRKQTKNHQS